MQSGAAYIVIVAEAGEGELAKGLFEGYSQGCPDLALSSVDGRPDPSTLQAFLASASQGVNYTQGVWRQYTGRFSSRCSPG